MVPGGLHHVHWRVCQTRGGSAAARACRGTVRYGEHDEVEFAAVGGRAAKMTWDRGANGSESSTTVLASTALGRRVAIPKDDAARKKYPGSALWRREKEKGRHTSQLDLLRPCSCDRDRLEVPTAKQSVHGVLTMMVLICRPAVDSGCDDRWGPL